MREDETGEEEQQLEVEDETREEKQQLQMEVIGIREDETREEEQQMEVIGIREDETREEEQQLEAEAILRAKNETRVPLISLWLELNKIREDEMRKEQQQLEVIGIREGMKELSHVSYCYQTFNKSESSDWRNPRFTEELNSFSSMCFDQYCDSYSRFVFPILPEIKGVVKPCSYSDLEKITNFEKDKIHTTQLGRLFNGKITDGAETRSVIVKTWDLLLPLSYFYAFRPFQFCDEIELYETVNEHPYLPKLSLYCCERRLAVVYDEEVETVLSSVLLKDDFGWDKRISVATQLADLLAWLHEKKIAVGSVTASCIMINKEGSIKVFDFGSIYHRVHKDSVIPMYNIVGRATPENFREGWTMKCDVYIFGLLLMELITKKMFDSFYPFSDSIVDDTKLETYSVRKCFKEVDHQTVSDITELTRRCLSLDPGERPNMKTVFDDLKKLSMGERAGGK